MDHPNIAKVFDGGATPEGRPYFVMELVRGRPLTDYADDQSLSIADRIGLFIDICRAVQHAHQKGVLHRDLKPTNLLVMELCGLDAERRSEIQLRSLDDVILRTISLCWLVWFGPSTRKVSSRTVGDREQPGGGVEGGVAAGWD